VAKGKSFPSLKESLNILLTFILISIAWVFFRSENISQAINYLSVIFSLSFFKMPTITDSNKAFITAFLIVLLLLIEWMGREKDHALSKISDINSTPFRWLAYSAILSIVFFLGNFSENLEFIYFQF
jgi:alginate O-acetyltransferase complex protein AlgI